MGRAKSCRFVALLLLLALFGSAAVPTVLVAAAPEKKIPLEEVKARLDKARTPVERALIHIQISDIVLREVKDNVSLSDSKALTEWLDQYRQAITTAREIMLTSGRDPQSEPGGYKDLEITLRQHITWMATWKRKATDSKPIDDSITVASSIQKEMLDLLFPVIGEKPKR